MASIETSAKEDSTLKISLVTDSNNWIIRKTNDWSSYSSDKSPRRESAVHDDTRSWLDNEVNSIIERKRQIVRPNRKPVIEPVHGDDPRLPRFIMLNTSVPSVEAWRKRAASVSRIDI